MNYKYSIFIYASTLLLIVFFAALGSLGVFGSLGALGSLGAFGAFCGAFGAFCGAGADVDDDDEDEDEDEDDVVIISPKEPKLVVDAVVTDFLGVFKEMRSFFGGTNSPMI